VKIDLSIFGRPCSLACSLGSRIGTRHRFCSLIRFLLIAAMVCGLHRIQSRQACFLYVCFWSFSFHHETFWSEAWLVLGAIFSLLRLTLSGGEIAINLELAIVVSFRRFEHRHCERRFRLRSGRPKELIQAHQSAHYDVYARSYDLYGLLIISGTHFCFLHCVSRKWCSDLSWHSFIKAPSASRSFKSYSPSFTSAAPSHFVFSSKFRIFWLAQF
jgi:hypothetical protein